MEHLLSILSIPFFGNIFAILIVLIFCSILYRIHKSDANQLNFTDLFLDKKTGKIGGSEFRINTAFLATTWVLVYLTIKGTLTEWFVAAYLASFVADRMFSRNAKDQNPNVKDEVK